MTREQFAKMQAGYVNEVFSFTQGEEANRARFEQLAFETFDFLISVGAKVYFGFNPDPESAFNFLRHCDYGYRGVAVPAELRQRWQEWNEEYYRMRSRNPRLELFDLMHEISESHDSSSWPQGYEWRIQDWVDVGDPSAPPPFDDRAGIVTADFFQRLRKVRQSCGGWIYAPYHGPVVFAAEPEWQVVRAEQESASRKQREAWAGTQRKMARLEEIVAAARQDAALWNAVKSRLRSTIVEWPQKEDEMSKLSGPVRTFLEQNVKAISELPEPFRASVEQNAAQDIARPGPELAGRPLAIATVYNGGAEGKAKFKFGGMEDDPLVVGFLTRILRPDDDVGQTEIISGLWSRAAMELSRERSEQQ